MSILTQRFCDVCGKTITPGEKVGQVRVDLWLPRDAISDAHNTDRKDAVRYEYDLCAACCLADDDNSIVNKCWDNCEGEATLTAIEPFGPLTHKE